MVDACVESLDERNRVLKHMTWVSETLTKMLVAYDHLSPTIPDFDTLIQGMKNILMAETKIRAKKIETMKL